MAEKTAQLRVMHIISGDLWAGAEVQAYTLMKHLRNQCDISAIVLNPGRLADELQQLDIPVVVLDEAQYGSLDLVSKMRKEMFAFRPDIVHTHRQKENILGSLANSLSVRAKSVRTSHGAPEFKPQGFRKFQAWLDYLVGRYLQSVIIAVSDDLSIKLSDSFPKDKIEVVYNGVDVASLKTKATPAEFRRNAPDAKHIGIIGRIEPVKRIDLFVQMAEILKDQLPDQQLRFHIIGEGKLRPQIESHTKKSGSNDYIFFHGYRDDIPSCLASLDVLIMCSDHEGTPMIALEALALNTPVVAHNVGGLKEILEDWPDFHVTQHTAEGYAKAVTKFLEHSVRPQVRLTERYMANKNAEQTASLYLQLIPKKTGDSSLSDNLRR